MMNLFNEIENETGTSDYSYHKEEVSNFENHYYYSKDNDDHVCWIEDDDNNPSAIEEIVPPLVERWTDILPTDTNCKFTI